MSITEEQGSELNASATEESPVKTPERFEERLAQAMAGATEENAEPGPAAVEGTIAETVAGGVAQAKEVTREGAEKLGDLARSVQATSREAAQSVRSVASRHPIPAALTGLGAACAGIGVTWLLMGERRRAPTNGSNGQSAVKEIISNLPGTGQLPERAEAIETRAKDAVARATHETQDLAKRTQASIEGAAHGAAARVERVARDARAEAQLLGERAEKGFRDHPLAVGAGLVAFGTAVGISLPSTLRENRWLGKRRDAFVGRARSAARNAGRKLESLGKSAPVSGGPG